MTGEYIIIAILIIGSIAGMIWIAPDVREAFREPFGDEPRLPEEMRAERGGGDAPPGDDRTRHGEGYTP